MADTKISALTAVTTLTGASELAVNEAGTSKKATVSQVVNALMVVGQTAVFHLGADHSISSATATEVTGLGSVTLVAGTYVVKYSLICTTSSASVGLAFSINYTGTVTRMVFATRWVDTGVSAALGGLQGAANATTGNIVATTATRTEATGTPNMSAGFASAANQTADVPIIIEGVIQVSDGGDLELWHGSETATATVVESGSSLVVTRTA